MKVKKNDTVMVIAGKDDKKTGKVLRVIPSDNKVVVDGVNIQHKHQKARSAQETAGIVKQAGPIDASNVMVVCPSCNKPTRVGYAFEGDKKFRVCKHCGKTLDVKAEVKEAKKTAAKAKKATEKKAASKKKDAEKA